MGGKVHVSAATVPSRGGGVVSIIQGSVEEEVVLYEYKARDHPSRSGGVGEGEGVATRQTRGGGEAGEGRWERERRAYQLSRTRGRRLVHHPPVGVGDMRTSTRHHPPGSYRQVTREETAHSGINTSDEVPTRDDACCAKGEDKVTPTAGQEQDPPSPTREPGAFPRFDPNRSVHVLICLAQPIKAHTWKASYLILPLAFN